MASAIPESSAVLFDFFFSTFWRKYLPLLTATLPPSSLMTSPMFSVSSGRPPFLTMTTPQPAWLFFSIAAGVNEPSVKATQVLAGLIMGGGGGCSVAISELSDSEFELSDPESELSDSESEMSISES